MKGVTSVCCEYEDNLIKPPQFKALKDLGVSFDFTEDEFDENEGISCSASDVAHLFFEMVKTQIPGFKYKFVKEKKTINGFWSEDFNLNFGYGCFF